MVISAVRGSFLSALLFLSLTASRLTIEVKDDIELSFCMVSDLMTSTKILIEEDTITDLTHNWFSYMEANGNGTHRTVFFTPCGDLPRSLKNQCGIRSEDKDIYSMIYFTSDFTCVAHLKSEIVTASVNSQGDDLLVDLTYAGHQQETIVVTRFRLKKGNQTSRAVNMVTNNGSRHMEIFEATVRRDAYQFKSMYFFTPQETETLMKASIGVGFILVYLVCTFYFNHLCSCCGFHPFGFSINLFVSYRILDFWVELFLFPNISRYITTSFSYGGAIVLGILLERMGSEFAYRKSMVVLNAIVFFDLCLIYLLANWWVLTVGLICFFGAYKGLPSFKIIRNKLKDQDEWSASLFLSANIFVLTVSAYKTIKSIGAFRIMYYEATTLAFSPYFVMYQCTSFLLIPLLAYARYLFSSRRIKSYLNKKKTEPDLIRLSLHPETSLKSAITDEDIDRIAAKIMA